MVARGFCNFVGYIKARVRVFHGHAQKKWGAQMHALARCSAKNLGRDAIEQQERLELGASGGPFNTRDFFCQSQAFGLCRTRIEKAAEPSAQVWSTADVGFGMFVRAEKGEDPGLRGNLRQSGFGCGRVESCGLREHWLF